MSLAQDGTRLQLAANGPSRFIASIISMSLIGAGPGARPRCALLDAADRHRAEHQTRGRPRRLRGTGAPQRGQAAAVTTPLWSRARRAKTWREMRALTEKSRGMPRARGPLPHPGSRRAALSGPLTASDSPVALAARSVPGRARAFALRAAGMPLRVCGLRRLCGLRAARAWRPGRGARLRCCVAARCCSRAQRWALLAGGVAGGGLRAGRAGRAARGAGAGLRCDRGRAGGDQARLPEGLAGGRASGREGQREGERAGGPAGGRAGSRAGWGRAGQREGGPAERGGRPETRAGRVPNVINPRSSSRSGRPYRPPNICPVRRWWHGLTRGIWPPGWDRAARVQLRR